MKSLLRAVAACLQPSSLPAVQTRHFGKLAALSLALSSVAIVPQADAATAGIFGGGPFYSGGQARMDSLRASGFTTVILWTIHINSSNGDLVLNDQLVASNGAYVGNGAWPGQLATLKQAPTSVNRIEIAVGSWGVNDFQSAKTLMAAQGTGSGSILYRNFQALKNATGADAVQFDDETLYDVNATVQFGNMLATMGYKVTLCPYTNMGFWQNVKSQLGSKVDAVYLQCYDGGAGNDPGSWSNAMGGMRVYPGLWCIHGGSGDSANTARTKLSNWRVSAGVAGGFIWLYDDLLSNTSGGSPADYANAIHTGLANPSGIINGGTYELEPQCAIGSRLDVNGGAGVNGTNVQIWGANGSSAQKWRLIDSGGGYFRMVPECGLGQRLDVAGAGTAAGTNVQTWQDFTNTAQNWRAISVGNGVYEFEPQNAPGTRLDVSGGGNAQGTNVQIWTSNSQNPQRWRLLQTTPTIVLGGTYELAPEHALGLRLDVNNAGTTNGTNIQAWTTNSSAAQRWKLFDGGSGTFELEPTCAAGSRADVAGAGTANGTNVALWTDANVSNQRWRLLPMGTGFFELEPVHTVGARLDVSGSGISDGTNVQIWSDNNSVAQRWLLIRVQ